MFYDEFDDLVQATIEDDDIELYQIFLEHKKHSLMLQAAHQVLAKYPDGLAAYRGLLLLALERSQDDETRDMLQEAVNELEFGFPEWL